MEIGALVAAATEVTSMSAFFSCLAAAVHDYIERQQTCPAFGVSGSRIATPKSSQHDKGHAFLLFKNAHKRWFIEVLVTYNDPSIQQLPLFDEAALAALVLNKYI